MRRAILLILTLALIPAGALLAEDPAGRWSGSIQLPAAKLDVELDLAKGASGWKGDISIPAQGARDIPLEAVSIEGKSASFRIPGIPGTPTFTGTIAENGETMTGTFTQGGQSFPFELTRGKPADWAGRLAGYDAVVVGMLKDFETPGVAIAIVADGDVVYAKGHGVRDVAKGLPMTADTLLPIGSATKAFTTFTIGTLIDEGKVAWDEPVLRYLPFFRLNDPELTSRMIVRDLVTHRSGFPRHDLVWYNNEELNRRQLVERLAHLEPSAPIRARFQYNNLMYLAAGHLIEELTGGRWEDAVRARILDPLGMARTNFVDAVSARDPNHAKPYRERDDRIEEIPFREVGEMGPAGSINSSVSEMSRWIRMLLASGSWDGKALVQPTTWRELRTPQVAIAALPQEPEFSPSSYAHGWFVDSYRGHLRTHHGGAIDGFMALVTLFPNDGVGIVVLANAGGTPVPNLATLHATDLLFELPGREWAAEALDRWKKGEAAEKEAGKKKSAVRVAGTKPSHRLADFAGHYSAPGYGILRVATKGEALEATYNRIATPLEHWHYDVFSGLRNAADPTFEDMKYRFETDVNGAVTAVEVALEPSVEPIVFRKQPAGWMSDPAALAKFEGEYELGAQTLRVALRGTTLVLSIQGQPPRELNPAADGWFELARLEGFRLRFPDARTMELHQPNGLFTATRK